MIKVQSIHVWNKIIKDCMGGEKKWPWGQKLRVCGATPPNTKRREASKLKAVLQQKTDIWPSPPSTHTQHQLYTRNYQKLQLGFFSLYSTTDRVNCPAHVCLNVCLLSYTPSLVIRNCMSHCQYSVLPEHWEYFD
jgi:hypothetical protein